MKRAAIEPLLPSNYRRALLPGTPLSAQLDVMEALQAPSEQVLAGLEVYFNSRLTPDRFVPYLARWVDLGPLLDRLLDLLGAGEFPSGTGRLRELVAQAAALSKWRGTRRGLITFLEIATGVRGFVVEERSGGRPFHFLVTAPGETQAQRPLIESLIDLEKPAYTTYDLQFAAPSS
jgi:phage tail-like protein